MLRMHGLKRDSEKEREKEDRAGDVKNRWKKQRVNGQAEWAACIGKLYNECLSLATMMDESGMLFVMNAIFFESHCCFPVLSLCELNHAAIRSVAMIRPLTVDDLTIKCAEHMQTCMTLFHC